MRNPRRLAKMPCSRCGAGTRVVDSYPTAIGIQRRRECPECGARFTSVERVAVKEKPQDIGVSEEIGIISDDSA